MAKIRDLADALASRGRGQDSLLAHINPREAMVLKARGGSGVRNPRTGILEFDDNAPSDGSDASVDATAGGNFGGVATANEGDVGFNGPNGLGFGDNSSVTQDPFESNFNNTDVLGFNSDNAPESNFQDTNVLSEPNESQGKFGKGLMSFLSNQALNGVLGKAGIPGMAVSMAQNPAQGFFNGIANMATMGGFGIGQALGMSGPPGDQGPSTGTAAGTSGGTQNNGPGGSMNWGDLGQGLAGMYMGNRSNNQYSGAINSINDLYGVNSPYAQNMRQQLERRDAAAGRRSQYGNREVELAGNLAQAQGQALTSPGYANLMQQRNIQQNQGLNTLLTLLSKSGALKGIGGGLQGLFGGGSGTGNGAPGQYSLGPNGGPQQPIDTQGITDMFNQGGGNGGGFGGGGSDYTPWEGGWGG